MPTVYRGISKIYIYVVYGLTVDHKQIKNKTHRKTDAFFLFVQNLKRQSEKKQT